MVYGNEGSNKAMLNQQFTLLSACEHVETCEYPYHSYGTCADDELSITLRL